MSTIYTRPISVTVVDQLFSQSLLETDTHYFLQNPKDPFVCLFVLFQPYTQFSQINFRGHLTKTTVQRALRVIDRLDLLLPQESAADIAQMQQALTQLINVNQPLKLEAKTVNALLQKLRTESSIWADEGVAEFLIAAFDFTIELSLEELELLKQSLAAVAHEDPQADYEQALKIKRVTDHEIDADIVYRPRARHKQDPAGLLLGFVGANQFKSFEKLSDTENQLLQLVFSRRFPRTELEQNTDTASLGNELGNNARSVNALKSKIDGKVRNHLAKPLFSQDRNNNLTFSHTFTCMHESLRQRQRLQQSF